MSVFLDGINQDQTAQNVQSDFDLCRRLSWPNLYDIRV